VFAAFLYPGLTTENRELAFGLAAGNLLPVGLIGLMIAALIAAVMSTCDAFMVHASALFTRNLYLPFINPRASDNDLLRVGRISAVFVVVGGVLFAFVFPSIVHGLIELWKVTAYLGLAFWFGVIWKKANRHGAWASALTMAALSIFTGNFLDWSLPEQIMLYLPIGIIVMTIVSWLTKPEPAEKLRQFYTLLATPVGKENRLNAANVNIKLKGISEIKKTRQSKIDSILEKDEIDDGLLIVDLLSLKKKFSWKKYRTDILGFFIATVIALLMIFSVILLAQIGG
jgi:Na+/proline symporter